MNTGFVGNSTNWVSEIYHKLLIFSSRFVYARQMRFAVGVVGKSGQNHCRFHRNVSNTVKRKARKFMFRSQ